MTTRTRRWVHLVPALVPIENIQMIDGLLFLDAKTFPNVPIIRKQYLHVANGEENRYRRSTW